MNLAWKKPVKTSKSVILWAEVYKWYDIGKNDRIIPSIWPQTSTDSQSPEVVSNIWNGRISIFNGIIFKKLSPLSPNYWDKMVFLWKNIPKSLLDTIFFYLIKISLLSAHYICILAILEGLGPNGWYQTI